MALEQYRPRFNLMPPITKNILIINVIMFITTILFGNANENESGDNYFSYMLALHYFESEDFRVWQFITYMFMHGSFMHLFFNMFGVWMFGTAIENMWGSKRYLNYYILTGLGAALAHYTIVYFQLQPDINQINNLLANSNLTADQIDTLETGKQALFNSISPLVGASGAVFGILVAFGIYFPNTLLFIIPFPFPVKAKYFVIIYGLIELFLGLRNAPGDNVAHFAHLGGLVCGFILIQIWKRNDRTYY